MFYAYGFLLALLVASAALFLVLRCIKPGDTSLACKLFASFCFVVIGVLSMCVPGNRVVKAMFLLGLMCGLIGDVVLELKVNTGEHIGTYLNLGTMFFAFGHVAYFFGIIIYVSGMVVTGWWWMVLAAFLLSLLVAALIVTNGKAIKLDFTGFKWQTYIYSSELIFVMIISVCLSFAVSYAALLGVGFVLFLASDLVLSKQYFGGKPYSKPLTIVNHILYYLAQVLIVSFVFYL